MLGMVKQYIVVFIISMKSYSSGPKLKKKKKKKTKDGERQREAQNNSLGGAKQHDKQKHSNFQNFELSLILFQTTNNQRFKVSFQIRIV